MNIQDLQNQKNQLKSTTTKITSIDGQIYIEENGQKRKEMNQKSCGYVIDTKPDKIASEIIEHLYLGSQDCVMEKEYLQSLQIKHILCVAPMIKSLYPNDFNYKIIEILDLPSFDIKLYIDECIQFIDSCLDKNETIICHCNAGISRSATVIIAYLIKRKHMTFQEAYNLVKIKRPSIRPNDGFLLYLKCLDQLSLISK